MRENLWLDEKIGVKTFDSNGTGNNQLFLILYILWAVFQMHIECVKLKSDHQDGDCILVKLFHEISAFLNRFN